jgi:hypothetical protein
MRGWGRQRRFVEFFLDDLIAGRARSALLAESEYRWQ